MLLAGIVAITMSATTVPPTVVAEPVVEVSHIGWQPYDDIPLDEDIQLLVHEVVEESFPEINERLIMSLIHYESAGQMIYAKSGSGAFGYCQLKPSLFYERAQQLGVSAYTEYGNIYLCADWFKTNCEQYGDVAYVLDMYRGGKSNADKWNKKGQMSPYSKAVLDMTEGR